MHIEDVGDKLVSKLGVEEHTPGICISLSTPDTTETYVKGIRDTDGNPITEYSNFRIASITKQFTAVSILQLIEKRSFTFNTTLGELFPEFPEYGKSTTIEQLLTHTSGLRDYEESLPAGNFQVSDEDVLSIALYEKDTLFPMGTGYSYSNGGYCILALIVAKLSELSFGEYLKKNLFDPAGMDDSRLNSSAHIPERVYGFSKDSAGVWHMTDQDRTSATQGDGGIYSSAHDLHRWNKAWYEDKSILSDTYLQLMTTPQVKTDENDFYGFGIHIASGSTGPYYYHVGESIGFEHILVYVPEQKMSLAILSNIPGSEPLSVAKEILANLSL